MLKQANQSKRGSRTGGVSVETLMGVALVALAGLGGMSSLGYGMGNAVAGDAHGATVSGAAGGSRGAMAISALAGIDGVGRVAGAVADGASGAGRVLDAASTVMHLETTSLRGSVVSEGVLALGMQRRAVNAVRYAIGDNVLPHLERTLQLKDALQSGRVTRYEATVRPLRTKGEFAFDLLGFGPDDTRPLVNGGTYRTIFGTDALAVVVHDGPPRHVRVPNPQGRTVTSSLHRLIDDLRPKVTRGAQPTVHLTFERVGAGRFDFTAGEIRTGTTNVATLAP